MKFNISKEAIDFMEKEFRGKTIRIYPRRKVWSGNIYDWAMDEPKDTDEVYKEGNVQILLDDSICKSVDTIQIRYEEYEWGDTIVITSA